MGLFLEILESTPPEDMEKAAKIFQPYMEKKEEKSKPTKLLTLREFQAKLRKIGIRKRLDWLRNDLFIQCPALKDYAFALHAGRGRGLKIDERAVDWISEHKNLIDWRG